VKHAFRVIWLSLRGTYEELFVLAAANLLALLLCLPIVTAPPALAGLHNLAFYVVTEKRVEFRLFWEGFKEFALDSWKLTAINALVFGILGVDVWFYLSNVQGVWRVLGFVGVWMLAIWAVAQLYALPLLVRQEERKLLPLIKNTVLLTLAFPVFSVTVALSLLLLLALSLLLPILFVLVGPVFAAVTGAHALRWGIESVEAHRAAQDDDHT